MTAAPDERAGAVTPWGLPAVVTVAAAGVVTAVMGALRAGDVGLWLDEGITAVMTDQDLGPFLREVGRRQAGFLPHHLSLWVWQRFGDSEWWLRLLSVIGGVVAVVATGAVARRIGGAVAAGLAALGLLAHPSFVRYLTELRGYSFAMAFVALSCLTAARFAERPTTWRGAVAGGTSGLLLATTVFAWPLVLAQLVWVAWRLRRASSAREAAGPWWRPLRWAVVAGVVALVPALPALATSNQLNWIPDVPLSEQARLTVAYLGGRWWLAVFVVGLVLAVWIVARVPAGVAERARAELALVAVGAVAVPLGLTALSFVTPRFVDRYLAPALPLLLVVAGGSAAVALGRLGRARWPATAAVTAAGVALVLATFPGRFDQDQPRPEPLDVVAATMVARVEPGDEVRVTPSFGARALGYYWSAPPASEASEDPEWRGRCWVVHRSGSATVAPELRPTTRVLETIELEAWSVTLADACS